MPFFKTKPRTVKAVQWIPPETWPELYVAKDERPGYEDVILVDKDIAQIRIDDKKNFYKILKPGDWIVSKIEEGEYDVYSDEEFNRLFETLA